MTEPRDPRELLGMLAPRVQHFSMAPGGVPALTADDISHAIALLGRASLDGESYAPSLDADAMAFYLRFKYGGEDALAEEVALALRRKVVIDRRAAKWKSPRPYFVLDLCRLAVVESVDPQLCSWCCGIAYAIVDNRKIKCDGCAGTGHRFMRDIDRAGAMKCTPSAWAHSWRERYLDILAIVERWEHIGQTLSRRLGSSSSTSSTPQREALP